MLRWSVPIITAVVALALTALPGAATTPAAEPGAAKRKPAGDRYCRQRPPSQRVRCRARRRHVQLFGFTDNSVSAGQLSPDQSADMADLLKADVVRISFGWRWVEPYKDQYHWGHYDKMYRAYLARGIRPVFTILFAPWWTWDPSVSCNQWRENCKYPPGRAHDGEWREIAALLAARYPDAAGIEIWNEPNLHWFWAPRPDPARYTELQKAAYEAIKAVNPAMPVVNGGLLSVGRTNALGLTAHDFLAEIYRHGGRDSMDAINLHPYPVGLDKRYFLNTFAKVRSVRDANKDARKPLWVTEFGFTTTGTDPRYMVTPEEQALGLVDHYRAMRVMRDVDLLALYTLIDPKGRGSVYDPRDPNVGYGLVDPDLRPKPAFCALFRERRPSWTCPQGP